MVRSPKSRSCKKPYDGSDGEIINDSEYIKPESPLDPKKLGFKIENLIIKHMLTSCCNSQMRSAKLNQKVHDATCSNCGKRIQIKTTSLNYGLNVRVTKPSIEGTIRSPISIYKFQIKNGLISGSTIYTPDKMVNGPYYQLVKQDSWGGIVKPNQMTKIKRAEKVVIKKVNRKLF
jgi:hypothetical protein